MHYTWSLTMDEVLRFSRRLIREKKVELAKEILEYGASCGNVPARFELARLLKNTPSLEMPQKERFRLAEKLLLDILRNLDVPDRVTAKVSLELADLLSCERRTIGQYAMLLQARRAGAVIEDRAIVECRKRIAEMDIHAVDGRDALALGQELMLLPRLPKITEFFLAEACCAEDPIISGQAELELASFYERIGDLREAAKHYRLAQKNYPEYISK